MLRVKKLLKTAKLPTVGHAEDLGYDLYAAEDVRLVPGEMAKVRTGIAVQMTDEPGFPMGLEIRDRSSMAASGVLTAAGIIDHSYTGEIIVLMRSVKGYYQITQGQKIAQMLPRYSYTFVAVKQVEELDVTERGSGGFGSTGI